MEQLDVVVEVSEDDSSDLREFCRALNQDPQDIHSKPLDGVLVTQLVLTVTLPALPVLKSWLLARADRHKATSVSYRGLKLRGYTAREVERITKVLANELSDDTPES